MTGTFLPNSSFGNKNRNCKNKRTKWMNFASSKEISNWQLFIVLRCNKWEYNKRQKVRTHTECTSHRVRARERERLTDRWIQIRLFGENLYSCVLWKWRCIEYKCTAQTLNSTNRTQNASRTNREIIEIFSVLSFSPWVRVCMCRCVCVCVCAVHTMNFILASHRSTKYWPEKWHSFCWISLNFICLYFASCFCDYFGQHFGFCFCSVIVYH